MPAHRRPLGILGGTFDPVHQGHLQLARDVARELCLPQVLLVPAADPPHRAPPHASALHRLAMVERAVAGDPVLAVDARELDRTGPSYTFDTLAELRRERPHEALALIVGADAFLGLPLWHRWRELPRLAHLIVVPRPGVAWRELMAPELEAMVAERATEEPQALENSTGGRIYEQPVVPHPISATAIRAALSAGDVEAASAWLPPAVLDYILDHHLYRRRTDVR